MTKKTLTSNAFRAALVLAAGLAMPAYAQVVSPGCGELGNAYGPFDYTNAQHFRDRLPVVERVHFDAGVESLRGHADHPQALGGDIDYTLRAFPNHHRALYTMARYYLTQNKFNRGPLRYTARCYFERAMKFKPSDGVVRMIYGVYLYKAGNLEAAEQRFQEALERAPNDAEVHYNLGLLLAKSERYEEAKSHAEQAYALGHPMPGLRNKLKRAGHWD